MRRTPFPHRLTPVYLYFRWDLNPGNLELLTGNDPISLVYKTSASPLMLKKRIETPDGFEPTYHSFADWDLSHSDTVSFCWNDRT